MSDYVYRYLSEGNHQDISHDERVKMFVGVFPSVREFWDRAKGNHYQGNKEVSSLIALTYPKDELKEYLEYIKKNCNHLILDRAMEEGKFSSTTETNNYNGNLIVSTQAYVFSTQEFEEFLMEFADATVHNFLTRMNRISPGDVNA